MWNFKENLNVASTGTKLIMICRNYHVNLWEQFVERKRLSSNGQQEVRGTHAQYCCTGKPLSRLK